MSGRKVEKGELHGERLDEAHREPAAPRRRLLTAYLTAGLLVVALVAAMVAVVASGGGDLDSASAEPFGQHFDGLENRRVEAGVPTMAEGGGEHFHPFLTVYVRGQEVAIPPNIGIDPAKPPTEMAGLHTHDASGTIHNEAGEGSTLGQFFAIWGVPFSNSQVGHHEATRSETVRMWVDEEPSRAFGDLPLAEGQQIVVAFGGKGDIPPEVGP